MVSPTRWESQERGNVSVDISNPALNEFTCLKAFDVTFRSVFRHEIENPFVERDHCLHRCLFNRRPKFMTCFRFNELIEICPSKYSLDMFREIGRKSIIAVKNQFKGS